MRVIDAHSGAVVVPGGIYDGFRIHAIRWGFLGLRCQVLVEGAQMPLQWQELPVRLFHPAFFGERVAFLPT